MARRPPKYAGDEKRGTMRQMKSLLIAFRGRMDDELKPMGVTTSQMQMLHAVETHPGASGAQLARACRVTPQTAQGFLGRAEREGWIRRGKDAENDRLVTRSLTAKGVRLLEQADGVARTLEKGLWRGTRDEDFKRMNAILARCIANLEG